MGVRRGTNQLGTGRRRFGVRTALLGAGSLIAAGLVASALPATAETASAGTTTTKGTTSQPATTGTTSDTGTATMTYTASQTTPVPPASSFAGSGGGDGWGLAMTDTSVYNVFHHQGTLQVACHLQVDASQCWSPKTITDPDPDTGSGFAVSGQPGVLLDQVSGHLFVYATRSRDHTGGVVCVDTTQPSSNANPFCGFTALTAAGESPISSNSAISAPAQVGSKWYAFNYASGSAVTGGKNTMLCFDLKTKAACAEQPFVVDVGAGTGAGTQSNSDFPPPAVGSAGNEIFIPVNIDGVQKVACFDGLAQVTCSGAWPVAGADFAGYHGAAFPMLDGTGAVTGVCIPMSATPCFDLAGAVVATPANLAATITPNEPWNGPAFVLGPRVYVPHGHPGWNNTNSQSDRVQCYDFNLAASCVNFPKTSLGDLAYLYTVNADPQRPDCIWLNADGGNAQIQNFDAYSGGACGTGSIRVLASRFVAPSQACAPNNYTTLQILAPDRQTYSTGTVSFLDGDGQPIPGATDQPLDDTGSVDLTTLDLNTDAGLPQFLVTLTGTDGAVGEVTAKLTWVASSDPSCRPPSSVTLTPGSGTSDQPFTIRYSCAYVPTTDITNADGSKADGVVLDDPTTANDVDYEQTVHLQPGSYVATVACHGATATSEVATVTAPAPPPQDPPATPTSFGACCIESASPSPSASSTAAQSASPTPSSSAATRRALTLVAPEQALTPGHQAYLWGTGEPNSPVDLRCYTRPSTTYVTSRSAVLLDNAGRINFTLKLPASTRCFLRYADGVQTQSNSVKILVHANLSLSAVRTGPKTYVFGGGIHPVDGQTISIWRLGQGRPILTAKATSNGTTSWRAPVTFTGSGTYQFVATTPNTLTYASGTSNVITVPVH
ncbi:MAG: Conserved repeat protein [Frankiales bacterium]|nr:Conserved repeat protein [Frankiales bacterium]